MDERELWRELGQQLRVDAVRASAKAGSGHSDLVDVGRRPGRRAPRGAPALRLRRPHDPANDRLVFSKGHASPLVYGLFRAAGAISEDEFMTYRRFGSRLQGHPTPVLPWVDVATGSLGQGLPIGVGMAYAGKNLNRLPFRTWVICGDSEMAEGSMWEAAEHAAFYELDHLAAIVDVNRLGQRGETMHGWDLTSYTRRFEAFGWHAIEIDGHDVEAIDAAYREAEATTGRPTAIVARTVKGKGYSKVENQNGWHGKPVSEEAIEELGGIRNIRVDVARPEEGGVPPLRDRHARVARVGLRREGLDPQGVRRGSRRARHGAGRRRRARRRGLELDVRRALQERAPRPLRRDVHRRAADGRGRGRDPGARLEDVRVDFAAFLSAPMTSPGWPR